jgi:septal ring factor EnvC (AmiA/AmiB activator)
MTKEEKEKLIELSSLNRADNIKYISSEAQGIAIALDSDRLAPSMCKLERAYICGRRKSEKQIQIDAEQIRALQKQNGELTDKVRELEQKLEQTEKDLADYQFNYPTIKELQKENAELKEQHEVSARNMSSFIESLSKSENEAKKQLTKAKEIIHKVCYEYGIYDKDLMEEAKQFLKEE